MTTLALSVLVLPCLVACQGGSKPSPETPSVATPMEGMSGVMHEKLQHANALLGAITTDDMISVARNADALTAISERSEFQVHTTEAYTVHSRQFRDVTMSLAADARAGDLDAVALDYVQVTHSCLKCHNYLRREGLLRDMPGQES